jgi:hypothetical protein
MPRYSNVYGEPDPNLVEALFRMFEDTTMLLDVFGVSGAEKYEIRPIKLMSQNVWTTAAFTVKTVMDILESSTVPRTLARWEDESRIEWMQAMEYVTYTYDAVCKGDGRAFGRHLMKTSRDEDLNPAWMPVVPRAWRMYSLQNTPITTGNRKHYRIFMKRPERRPQPEEMTPYEVARENFFMDMEETLPVLSKLWTHPDSTPEVRELVGALAYIQYGVDFGRSEDMSPGQVMGRYRLGFDLVP